MTLPHLKILDRYMLSELSGPFLFGLSAFTLIFAATQLINIGRIVSETHAPLWAAVEAFLWGLPPIVVLAIPMAMLLGTLLAIQRLSGESEINGDESGRDNVRAHRGALAAGGDRRFGCDACAAGTRRSVCP